MLTTALAFSGGKDSWACLWLNKEKLSDIVVIWVNTGKNYPEVLATIEKAKSICPNFIELVVDRDGQNRHWGLPADIVPINWTRQGQAVTSPKSVMVQPYLNCCFENIGSNLQSYCKTHGITRLIRGQRTDESHHSSARDGEVVDGITYLQPIEDWSSGEVMDFVGQHMELPGHFQFKHSSMDCYDCTAYAAESQDRIAYTEAKHPLLYAEYSERKASLIDALSQATKEF